jgi:hypothetical protein
MKKIIIGLASLLLIFSVQAQDSGDKLVKKAKKAIGFYNLDNSANAEKLLEAKDYIDQALKTGELEADAKAFILKGEIYNELTFSQIRKKSEDLSAPFPNPLSGVEAYTAAKNGFSVADKKFLQKDAMKVLQETENHLNNMSTFLFQDQDYANAFINFKAVVELGDFLKEQKEDTRMDDPAIAKDIIYYTGISAYLGEQFVPAIPYFERAITFENSEPFAYEALYKCYKDSDNEKAVNYLNMGREKYPDDTGLLYAEINYMVAEGKLESLIDKLKLAIEKEPENVSIYTTLGSVYDNLQARAIEEGNTESASNYFDFAKDWYTKAVEIDSNAFEALYSLGALYYNKAAAMTEDINKYANDFSAEGGKKYDALKAEMDNLFDKAFPYFQASEAANPNDLNTLIAIKEIYARKGEFEKSNEYKEKIELLSN